MDLKFSKNVFFEGNVETPRILLSFGLIAALGLVLILVGV
jgi:hypothetical protein